MFFFMWGKQRSNSSLKSNRNLNSVYEENNIDELNFYFDFNKYFLTWSSLLKWSLRNALGLSGRLTHKLTIASFNICWTLWRRTYSSHSCKLFSSSKFDAIFTKGKKITCLPHVSYSRYRWRDLKCFKSIQCLKEIDWMVYTESSKANIISWYQIPLELHLSANSLYLYFLMQTTTL